MRNAIAKRTPARPSDARSGAEYRSNSWNVWRRFAESSTWLRQCSFETEAEADRFVASRSNEGIIYAVLPVGEVPVGDPGTAAESTEKMPRNPRRQTVKVIHR